MVLRREACEAGIEPDEGPHRPARRVALDALHEIGGARRRAELGARFGRVGHRAHEKEVAGRVPGVDRRDVRRRRESLAHQRQRVDPLGERPGGRDPGLRQEVEERLRGGGDALHDLGRLARDAVEKVGGDPREHRDAAVVREAADREPGDEQQHAEERRDVDREGVTPSLGASGEICGRGAGHVLLR